METFVLLPYLLLSRVPQDANTWYYGPEYTFLVEANMTTQPGPQHNLTVLQLCSKLKCRPLYGEILRCQFVDPKSRVNNEQGLLQQIVGNYRFMAPFEIHFNRQGIIQMLLVDWKLFLGLNYWSFYIDMIRAFVSQLNLGVELLHRQDGAFKDKESSYLGQCEAFVNISHEFEDTETSGNKDYEIMPVPGLQKKQGEILIIEKTRDLNNCLNKKNYVMMMMILAGKEWITESRILSSRSRIEISDTVFDSYTKNIADIEHLGNTHLYHETISLRLLSVSPAKDVIKPLEGVNVSPDVYGCKDI